MVGFFSRRRPALNQAEESRELNIVPFLDVVMNLIIFVLLSMGGFAAWRSLSASAPKATETPPAAKAGAAEELFVSVGISSQGFVVGSTLGVLPPIAKKADGSYDFSALSDALQRWKSLHGRSVSRVVISADATIPYETVVATMDAAIETPAHVLLFPDVMVTAP